MRKLTRANWTKILQRGIALPVIGAMLAVVVCGLRAQSAAPALPPAAQTQPSAPTLPPAATDQTPTPQTTPAGQAPPDIHPIAIVPLDSKIAGHAAAVTGDLQVYNGRAFVAANAAITGGEGTTRVTLPNRGTLQVCSQTTVKLAADTSAGSADVPALLMALDHGAVEMNFAVSRNSDTLMTPDFRILISGPGAAEVKVRLGPKGDTCVDNVGANAPYVLVSSLFEGGAYRVEPGQRVMFQHGSLREVVDAEKEPCGCPPVKPEGDEFPLAQSEGLAPMPSPAPGVSNSNPTPAVPVPPLVYKSTDHPAPAPVIAPSPDNSASPTPETKPVAPQKKRGFFRSLGRFFKKVFGAD